MKSILVLFVSLLTAFASAARADAGLTCTAKAEGLEKSVEGKMWFGHGVHLTVGGGWAPAFKVTYEGVEYDFEAWYTAGDRDFTQLFGRYVAITANGYKATGTESVTLKVPGSKPNGSVTFSCKLH